MTFTLRPLPPAIDLETKAILKKAASAHRYLAELKGVSGSIPNQGILINTLSLQEAKDSSAIENIIKAVTKGDSVQLVGFGTFSQGKRSARTGRNPKTGEAIKIAASKTAKFSAGKAFKDAVNKRK